MTITTLELIVATVTAYRLTVLLVDDHLLEPLRERLDWRATVATREKRRTAGAWSALQWAVTGGDVEPHGCAWCVSIWFGIVVTIGALLAPVWLFVALCSPLVCSAVAGILHALVNDTDR